MKHLWMVLAFCSCTYLVKSPTTTSETHPRPKYAAKLEVKNTDTLLDARPFFYYSSSHIAGAYHEDIHKYYEKKTTWPKRDLWNEARGLARKGVDPSTRVIVLGQGKSGRGEECRLAWNLLYMGIENVHFTKEDSVKTKRVVDLNTPLKDKVVYWEPALHSGLIAERRDLVNNIKNATSFKVLDVRSEGDYLKSQFPWDAEVDVQTLNIHWKDFLLENGRPNLAIAKRIESLGFKKGETIVVIDNDGVGASCAAIVLMNYGFNKVRLYAGGYQDLRQILENK